jgi:polar amino acid transport system substrate-binding protein
MSLARLWTLLFATMFSAAASQSALADELEDLIQGGVVRVAVPSDFPPFGSQGKDGKLEGYDIEVAKLVARDLGVKLELVPVSSVNRIPYLLTGKVDLVIATLGATPDRAKVIAFTDAYGPFFSAIYGDPKVQIKAMSDLAGKTIGVTRGTVEDGELTRLLPPGASVRRFEDNGATLNALASGQVDLIATGSAAASALAVKSPGRAEKKLVLRDSPVHIGVRRNQPDLVAWLNVFISYHKKPGGELDTLSRRWLDESVVGLPAF